jgi:hypothetical protein
MCFYDIYLRPEELVEKCCMIVHGSKVRTPIPLVYVGFYTMNYWMILTTIL